MAGDVRRRIETLERRAGAPAPAQTWGDLCEWAAWARQVAAAYDGGSLGDGPRTFAERLAIGLCSRGGYWFRVQPEGCDAHAAFWQRLVHEFHGRQEHGLALCFGLRQDAINRLDPSQLDAAGAGIAEAMRPQKE